MPFTPRSNCSPEWRQNEGNGTRAAGLEVVLPLTQCREGRQWGSFLTRGCREASFLLEVALQRHLFTAQERIDLLFSADEGGQRGAAQ